MVSYFFTVPKEPVIVVNPLDSQNVAMASLRASRVSTDGGLNWTAETLGTVPDPHVNCGDPSLAFDSQGRLFWTYLGCLRDASDNLIGIDIFVAQLNPVTGEMLAAYPVNITASAGVNLPATSGFFHDKEWLAADSYVASQFSDRLHVAWIDFPDWPGWQRVLSTFSTDQGITWAPVVQHSPGTSAEGDTWPVHNAVAPNGDVYVAYHSQTGLVWSGGSANPDGVSGKVFVSRSVDGGATFAQKNLAYLPGQADVTWNVQTVPGTIPGTDFWMQGSDQAWVLPDPLNPGFVYVVANDDTDNTHGTGDDADVYIVRSADNGLSWGDPIRVDHGPGETFAVFPTAAIDGLTGCLAVMWYDNRLGQVNGSSNFLLDVFYTVSEDQGLTFAPDVQINDVAFDPDLGASVRFPGPPATLRIGEYIGVTLGNGTLSAVWTGNTVDGQQIITDSAVVCGGSTIPTVSEWGIVIMALLTLATGSIVFLRRCARTAER